MPKDVDQIEFDYSPEKPLSAEQRIELLELEVVDLRRQFSALVEQLGWLETSSGD